MKKVEITRPWLNITTMQVCCEKDATDEEILEVCNSQNFSGTENGWIDVIREGEGAPVECEIHKGRIHVLIQC